MPASYIPEQSTVVQWYLTVGLGRETNPNQKAEKRSVYGIFRFKKMKEYGIFSEGGGIDEIRDIFKNRNALRTCGSAVT